MERPLTLLSSLRFTHRFVILKPCHARIINSTSRVLATYRRHGEERELVKFECQSCPRKTTRAFPMSRTSSTGPRSHDHGTWSAAANVPSKFRADGDRRKLDFGNSSTFQKHTVRELLRGLIVLKLSSYEKFVDNSLKIMSISQNILGQRLFDFVARCTFYGHFIAGNGEAETRRLVKRFEEQGIATILAITAEEDVGESKKESYDEPRYDRNTKGYMECMDLSVALSTRFRPVSQLKLTSFAKADVLARITEALAENGLYYENDSLLSIGNLAQGLDGKMVPIPELTGAENNHLRSVLQRLNKISEQAVKNNVQILVDAEKTIVNPGITLIALALMLKFNRTSPFIWNTYQCYLKRAFVELQKDLRWSESQGICFGVKIVRGAYMDAEREHAERHQMEDPINAGYEATSEMYNNVVGSMLDHIHKNPGRCGIIVATHNEDSVLKAVAKMEELGLLPTSGEVIFGQVLGISDHVTVTLGQAGYLIYKSSPYGPVNDVLPYLARRAQESSSVFQNLRRERLLIHQELKRRMRMR